MQIFIFTTQVLKSKSETFIQNCSRFEEYSLFLEREKYIGNLLTQAKFTEVRKGTFEGRIFFILFWKTKTLCDLGK